MQEIVRYIFSLLLYGHDSAIEYIHYTQKPDATSIYRLTIIGDGLEGSLHYPDLSEPKVEQLPNGHYVIHTDIVYNTFFFLSRAEELLNPQRDEYGRFLARYSRLDSSVWQTPLIDTYSRLVLQLLDLPFPAEGFSAIHLTHDIDTLTQYRHWRGAAGGICRGQWKQVKNAWRDIHNDPAYTFPWMIRQDASCIKQHTACSMIYFIKHTSGKGIDYPQYNLHGRDWKQTAALLQHSGAQTGIHSSACATCPLPQGTVHRSHYLCCSIERMQQLVEAGYTDDYTMGFADQIGFRLQTTRPVRWINPLTRSLTSLCLHPLTVMDCTLSNTNYMNLSENEALDRVRQLIDGVRTCHGEINLLWHNTSFADGSYHRSLYPAILRLL